MTDKPASTATPNVLQLLSAGTPLPVARSNSFSDPSLAPGEVATHESTQRAALVVGDIVADRYRVEAVIGAGGMGIVYKAKHLELDTWVAIKVIRPDIARNSSL